jgi:hypothetical protein
MSNGILIFAHNSTALDYALMSVIAGGLAKKHLNVPVSLATDKNTVLWMKNSNIYDRATEIFDKIILIEKPKTNNQRKLHDGEHSEMIPFTNTNRTSAWDVTPYDRTLLIDSDYLIFTNSLNEYWSSSEVLISSAMNDINDKSRAGYHDRYVSDTGVHMFWATTVMFSKNDSGKRFFELVNYVKNNYQYYGDLFRFDTRQYRNDIAFSVTKHILDGFETDSITSLPPVLTAIDRDMLHSVDTNGKLTFLVSPKMDSTFVVTSLANTDIHIMNKQSIIRNATSLLELI